MLRRSCVVFVILAVACGEHRAQRETHPDSRPAETTLAGRDPILRATSDGASYAVYVEG